MHDDLALDLRRVDVRTAGDDHVGLAVTQEQVPVLVEIADVADGEEAVPPGGRGLARVALVHEVGQVRSQIHGARYPGRAFLTVRTDDHDLADRPRLAHRAGLGQPVLRRGQR